MKEKIRYILIGVRNVIIGFNLISLGMIFRPMKLVGTITTLLFYYRTLTNSGRLEQKNPENIIKSNLEKYSLEINTNSYFWDVDPSYTKDILTLCILPKLLNAKTIFEIGTLDGYTALHLAMNSVEDAKVFTLDLPADGSVSPSLQSTEIDIAHQHAHSKIREYRFTNTVYFKKIVTLFGDSATFDYSLYKGKIDLFFIDGAHSYEYVKADTLNAIQCVRSGGVICWHDYGRMGVNGVSKWLHEYSKLGIKIYSVPGSSLAYTIKT